MGSIYYALHGRNGEYLRPIDEAELRSLLRDQKATLKRTKRGEIKRVHLGGAARPMNFLPIAQANRTSFLDSISAGVRVWTHSRQALQWQR